MRLNTTVDSIDMVDRKVAVHGGERLHFDYLVLATGAAARLPEVPGQDLTGIFCLRDLSDAIAIKQYLNKNTVRRVLLIGAGLISLEMCEAFRLLGLETTIIYRKDLPMARLGEEFGHRVLDVIESNGVKFLPNRDVKAFQLGSSKGLVVHTNEETVETDLVLVGMGVVPQVSLALDAGVVIGPTGAVAVNDHMQTNFPFVYSAGDCCESFHRVSRRPVYVPFGDVANKQGRTAGANIGGQESSFPGVIGSYCCKVFDWELGGTGLTESEAGEAGLSVEGVTIRGSNKAGSYPGARELWLSITAESGGGRLVGAHAIGGEGVVARINILAAAITAGLSVSELAHLDLAYAPPFSGSWDLIHIAAQQLLK